MKEPKVEDIFEKKELEHLRDFDAIYNDIRITNTFDAMAFRGQSDSKWGLIPSIFRDFGRKSKLSNEDIKQKISRELLGVQNFIRLADKIGIDLPGNYLELLNLRCFASDILRTEFFKHWYNIQQNNYLEIIGLSQHHGILTRFLDFSFNPYVALYFAAEGALKKLIRSTKRESLKSEFFSLWMIERNYLFETDCLVKHFEVPLARNKYLQSQKGLFLYPQMPIYDSFETFQKTDFDILEIIISNSLQKFKRERIKPIVTPVITQFNFPYSSSPFLLMELDDRYEINISTIKPSLDNIVVYERFMQDVMYIFEESL